MRISDWSSDVCSSDLDINDAAIVAGVVARHETALLPWLDGPPQTNEAGRSSAFIAAMLWLADRGLPPRFQCLEIGSSAGITLMIDRYHYDLGGVQVGPRPGLIAFKIGRASCRARGCQYVYISVVAVVLKNKKYSQYIIP